MKGRTLLIGFLALLAIFTAALWWFQTYAFYEEFSADAVTIAGRNIEVSDFKGIDASTSPIKMRACMRIDPGAVEGLETASYAVPLVAPNWFDCFDAKSIARALETGAAAAYRAATGEYDGTERIVAVFPDGKAFMWRQLTEEFAKQ